MTAQYKLRGLTWDHPRGYDPLVACSARYAEINPNVKIEWHKQSLHDFGASSVEELARSFDLLLIDHPFMGQAARTRCFLDLRDWIAPNTLSGLSNQGVGASGASYIWQDQVFALPTDAAAHVASYRPDLMTSLGLAEPSHWEGVIEIATRARVNGQTLAWSGTPTDSACTLLTLAANLGRPAAQTDGEFISEAVLQRVMTVLHWLVENSQASCLDDNPIRMYEAMADSDRMIYCPAAFGYANYARETQRPRIQFAPLAAPGDVPFRGGLLGGAGMAISSHTKTPVEAAEFLVWIHQADVQSGLYLDAGGQPGNQGAWHSAAANARTHNFFSATLSTLASACVRPRFAGFVPFIESAGMEINRCLRGKSSFNFLRNALIQLYEDAWSLRDDAASTKQRVTS